ncbi:MAG: polyprenol monophosphomannose synthase [Candidatus Omnitrophica bacterium]|nr:polyprenol monophosphomannose synthase [Candidatus Omnitrophota bacterium]
MKNEKIIVVIPTYNEKENIVGLIQRIEALNLNIRIIVVDDNSPDGTWQVVEDIGKRLPRVEIVRRMAKRGLGAAYVEGFKRAIAQGADFIIGMDADFSHDPSYTPDFLKAAEESDVVIGSRYLEGGISVLNWPLWRIILSSGANTYARLITGLPVNDVTSGFICYRKRALSAISLDSIESDGYSFLVEMKYRIFKKGFKIKEIPIVFVERRKGRSKMSLGVFIESVIMVLRLRLGLYKK